MGKVRAFVLLILIVSLFFYLVTTSDTFQIHTSKKMDKEGLERIAVHYEWHWENLFYYIKHLHQRATVKIKQLIYRLK